MMKPDFYKLILITHRQELPLNKYLYFIEECVASGVTCIQLREKNATAAFKMKFALELKALLAPFQIPLMINDDLHLAQKIDAEGVHLGQTDGDPIKARTILGCDKLIGLSIESEVELAQAEDYDVNYVAASAIFASEHKNNLRKLWGIEGLKQLCKKTKHPVVAIGGIDLHNTPSIMQAGAKGIAVIGALHHAEDSAGMAKKLRHLIDNAKDSYDHIN